MVGDDAVNAPRTDAGQAETVGKALQLLLGFLDGGHRRIAEHGGAGMVVFDQLVM